MTDEGDSSRTRLLAAAVGYIRENGVADLTLRRLAAAIGTSHRMLIYHFTSKEGLLIAVIRAVEHEQRELLAGFEIDASLSPAETMLLMWEHLSDPVMWASERLFFEVYGQALQARPNTAGFLDDMVKPWLDVIVESRREQGVPDDVVESQARVDLAVTRGLLLDLLATGERDRINEAMMQYAGMFDAWRAGRADL